GYLQAVRRRIPLSAAGFIVVDCWDLSRMWSPNLIWGPAAVLALGDLSGGERLVSLSLASFADRESRACPERRPRRRGRGWVAVATGRRASSSSVAASSR